MINLELSISELVVIEDALEGFIIEQDEYLDVLDDLLDDGLEVSDVEYFERERSAEIANFILDQIDEIWYFEEEQPDPFEELWTDEYFWDDPEFIDLAELELDMLEEDDLVDA